MPTCGICGKSKETPNELTVYTARKLGQTKVKSGIKQYTITTHYGEFEEHLSQVCNSCTSRRGCLFPIIAYVIAALLLFFALGGAGYSMPLGEKMMYVGGALFIAFLPGGLVWALFGPEKALVRRALAARKSAQPSEEFKGYTPQEYKMAQKAQD